jgi:hypothetical protein
VKVGDLVRRKNFGYMGVVVAVLGGVVKLRWCDTLELDHCGVMLLEVINEHR